MSVIIILRLSFAVSCMAVTATSALRCFICDTKSEIGYFDAEKNCNSETSLQLCPDVEDKACMIEAFRPRKSASESLSHHSSFYRIVKRCLNDCPRTINGSAEHTRCCGKDACNDVISIDVATSAQPTSSTEAADSDDNKQTTDAGPSVDRRRPEVSAGQPEVDEDNVRPPTGDTSSKKSNGNPKSQIIVNHPAKTGTHDSRHKMQSSGSQAAPASGRHSEAGSGSSRHSVRQGLSGRSEAAVGYESPSRVVMATTVCIVTLGIIGTSS